MEHRASPGPPISVYREFAPRSELREYVRALAWFGPADEPVGSRAPIREYYVGADVALTPSFADAHSCLLFSTGVSYRGNNWQPCSATSATVMGAVTRATQPPGDERLAIVGVYLRPRGGAALLALPAAELTDRIISLTDLWKRISIAPEQTNLDSVETLLTRRLRAASLPDGGVRITELASHVRRRGGQVSVANMADLAGLSRQHLGRLFLQYVGVSPKLYARLARFRTGLYQMGNPQIVDGWSRLAARLGYADQSHFIAEVRTFTSFTPEQLARGDRFHPFIGDAT
jgi:AraC-like DNA-binding protein